MSIRANVDARRLNERVRFERAVETQTSSGSIVPTWALIVECWAGVDGAKANEAYIADGTRSLRDYVFWIRADVFVRFALTVKDRIVWKGSVFNIGDIPDQGLTGRLITVIARTGLNEG